MDSFKNYSFKMLVVLSIFFMFMESNAVSIVTFPTVGLAGSRNQYMTDKINEIKGVEIVPFFDPNQREYERKLDVSSQNTDVSESIDELGQVEENVKLNNRHRRTPVDYFHSYSYSDPNSNIFHSRFKDSNSYSDPNNNIKTFSGGFFSGGSFRWPPVNDRLPKKVEEPEILNEETPKKITSTD